MYPADLIRRNTVFLFFVLRVKFLFFLYSLTYQIVALEAHQEELREQLERSRRKEDAKSALPRPERRVRKSRSVPSVADLPPGPRHRQYQPDKTNEDRQTNADIDEVIRLHDKLCELSFQVSTPSFLIMKGFTYLCCCFRVPPNDIYVRLRVRVNGLH